MGFKDLIKGFGLEGEGQNSTPANDNTKESNYDADYERENEEEEMEQEYTNEKAVSIRVFRPKKFEEATEIAANLLQGCLIFLNLESTDKVTSRRILDYMLGATYILEGDLQPVSSAAFIISPRDVDISGAILTSDPIQSKFQQGETPKANDTNGGFSAL